MNPISMNAKVPEIMMEPSRRAQSALPSGCSINLDLKAMCPAAQPNVLPINAIKRPANKAILIPAVKLRKAPRYSCKSVVTMPTVLQLS